MDFPDPTSALPAPVGGKMPDPLIILCPPRSFSSVVCGIIGQHPQCYGLPELNLFMADTLTDATGAFAGRNFGRDGLRRALAQLHDGRQDEETIAAADAWILEHGDWPIHKVWAHIQECVGPRILVEKSPSNVFRRDNLDRVLRVFPNANILHLVRHPRSTTESIVSLRTTYAMRDSSQRKSYDPENIWRLSHELVTGRFTDLPIGQYMRVKGERLLAALDIYLPQICAWLGIRRDPEAIEAMLHPENSPYAGPGPESAPRGNDPNFLSEPKLDFERLRRLREPSLEGELSWRPGETFEPSTIKLARQFGYS